MNEKEELRVYKQREEIIESAIGKNLWQQFNNFLMARIASRDIPLTKAALSIGVALLAPYFIPEEILKDAREGLEILKKRLPR